MSRSVKMYDDARNPDPMFFRACAWAAAALKCDLVKSGSLWNAVMHFRQIAISFIRETIALVPLTKYEQEEIDFLTAEAGRSAGKIVDPVDPDEEWARILYDDPPESEEDILKRYRPFIRVLQDSDADALRACPGRIISPFRLGELIERAQDLERLFPPVREALRDLKEGAENEGKHFPADKRKTLATQARGHLIRELKHPRDPADRPWPDHRIAALFDGLGVTSLDDETKVSKFRSERDIPA